MSDEFRFPRPDEHVTAVGRTGSGKTQLGAWLISESDLESRPHVVVDYKHDEFMHSLPEIRKIRHDEAIKQPGLYMVSFLPHEQDEMTDFYWRMWHRGNVHLHTDEIYSVGKNCKPFNSIMVQGRSKNISTTNLTQRPVECARFIFSEASHIITFHLNDVRDQKTVEGFFPDDLSVVLPEFHSRWYDIKRNKIFRLRPVPDADIIRQRFSERLKPKRRFL
jgi:hypothetical protein